MHIYSVKSNATRAAAKLSARERTGEHYEVEAVAGGFAVVSASALRARAEAEAAAAKAAEEAAKRPAQAAKTPAVGKARALIIAACSRPEGATAKELFKVTGWKFASWSHQMKLISKGGRYSHGIRREDGVTRYFLNVQAP